VEHSSAETLAAMHATEAASHVHAQLRELLLDGPAATIYAVVADLAKSGSCCGGTGGHGDTHRHDLALVGVSAEAQDGGGCLTVQLRAVGPAVMFRSGRQPSRATVTTRWR